MKQSLSFCAIENKSVRLELNQEVLPNGNGPDVIITSIFCDQHCGHQGSCRLTRTIRL